MYLFKQRCGVLLLIVLVTGCAIETDKRLAADVSLLSVGVDRLTQMLDDQYDVVEKVNRTTLLDSLNLQYDLGGTPAIALHPLFSVEERNSRRTVLLSLQIYVDRLKQSFEQSGLPELMRESGLVANDLQKLQPEKLDLSHSLDRFQTRDLVSSLSSFSKILLIPKRDREIAAITNEADPYVRKLALLFYLDIGAPKDQSDICRFDSPVSLDMTYLRELDLCKGGLRGLLATAIAADTVIWRQKLKLLALDKPENKAPRTKYIRHLLALQQQGQQQDVIFQETQQALVDLVYAHSELMERLNGGISDALANIEDIDDQQLNSIDLFVNKVARIERLSKEMNGLFGIDKQGNI